MTGQRLSAEVVSGMMVPFLVIVGVEVNVGIAF